MIKLRVDSFVLFGLSALNLDRLKEGKPIAFSGAGIGMPDISFAIMYGETEAAIIKELEAVGLGITPTTTVKPDPKKEN